MPHMRWSLKFTAKGKKDGSGTGPGKSYQGAADSFRNGVGTAGHQSFRSGSDVDRSDRDNDRHRESGANDSNSRTPIVTPPDANGGGRAESGQSKLAEPGQETEGHNSSPPYSAGREGAVGEGGNGGETEGDGQQRLEDMDESPRRVGGDNQDDVFDDESQEDADSLHASKTARMKSFADDPEAHALGDLGADWDGEALRSSSGGKGDSGEEEGMRRGEGDRRSPVSRGDDRFSGNDGGGSDSYHSETEAAEDRCDASSASPGNPSRGRTSTEGAKSGTFHSFGGISANAAVEAADDRERLRGRRVEGGGAEDDRDGDNGGVGKRGNDREGQDNEGGQEVDDELGDGDGDDDDDDDGDDGEEDEEEGEHGRERHYEVDDARRGVVEAPGDGDDGYGEDGYGRQEGGDAGDGGDDVVFESRVRDHLDPERRAHAHAYVNDLDNAASRVEMPGYGGTVGPEVEAGAPYGSDRKLQQQRNAVNNSAGLMPPAPPGAGRLVVNGISPVDARAAAALAARTRLAAGGMTVPDRGSGVQRPEPGAVVAAAAAAAALRRGPTPGSHSLPSMVLVPLEALKAHRKVPRSSDRRALVRYRDLPDRSRSFVVFVSHAWMRPHTTPSFAHPDTSSRGGEKYRLIAEAGDRIRAHLPPDVRVLLWIDYSCVDQDSTRRSKATMRGMREYMRRCDAILTVYPGEAADNGEEFLPNRFVKSCAWAGSYKSLAHYCTRGWCRLEMLLGQTEPLPQDGFMFNFLVPKKKKASGAKNSVGDRPHFLYGAHQRPHNGRIDVVPRQSSRWFEEHHPEQGNFTHESDRDAIRTVLAKQTNTMAKRTAAIAARYGTDPRRGGGSTSSRSSDRQHQHQQYVDADEYGRPHPHN